jgi:hypothetical protein
MKDENNDNIDDTISKEDLQRCDTEMIVDAIKSGAESTPNGVKIGIAKKERRQSSWWFKLVQGTKDKFANSGPELLFKIAATIATATGAIVIGIIQGWFNV